MESIRNRAKDRFPTVLLTLLSIVQALGLELLWDQARHRPELYAAGNAALIGWLQIVATLVVIILIWLTYASIVLRFRWTPTTADSIWPFFVGLLQFQLVDLMGDGSLGQWMVTLAILFAAMVLVSHMAMRKARQDEANSEFFARFKPATVMDFWPEILAVMILAIAGILLWQSDTGGWIGAVALIGTFAGLGNEIRKTAGYWRMSMGED